MLLDSIPFEAPPCLEMLGLALRGGGWGGGEGGGGDEVSQTRRKESWA